MYDIVIVGAGSSGSVIASRVSENPNLRVLLIEAGPDYPDLANTPDDLVNSHRNSMEDHDWHFNYLPTQGREVPFPRGRVTGGSSAVNTTIALRGVPEDYNEWAETGLDEWSWVGVLPAFNRLERDLDYGEADYHGDAGPITIRRYPHEELLPQHQAFLSAAADLGYDHCPDQNDPRATGAGPQPMNKLGRLRISCAVGYLAPARIRPNLDILANTSVSRVLVENGVCTGVEIVDALGHNPSEIRGTLVVVCAGALMTPPLLMRSGLGPRAQLESFSINVASDEPGVGANLCDHPALSVICEAKDGAIVDHDSPIIQTILRYTSEGSSKRADLQIEQLSYAGRPGGPDLFGIAAVLEYQYGRGEIRLASADPLAAPVVECRFCEDDRDLRPLMQAYRDTIAFTQVSPLKDMIQSMSFPDPKRPLDDDSLASLVRKLSGSGYHPCGTAKMGTGDDPAAVVDQYGRAHRVEQLVVADASIMPMVPRANTNLTCIMIGEKIGEWIRRHPTWYGL